jgi:hypothetical protein
MNMYINKISPLKEATERKIAMKKMVKIYKILAFVCILLTGMSAGNAFGSAVSIENKSVVNGQTFTAEVRLMGNSDNITSMVIPIFIGDNNITCNGVDFSGSLDGGNIVKSFEISGQEIYIYYFPADDGPTSTISANSGLIATLQLEVNIAAPDCYVSLDAINLDNSFEANGQIFSYWNRVEFADDSGDGAILPSFSPGLIIVQKVTDIAGDLDNKLPEVFELSQNYPNPFNPSTAISLALPQKSNVKLEIFNLLGQSIAIIFQGTLEAGYHEVTWDAGSAPSGVYFYRLSADDKSLTRKMMLLK